MYAIKSNGPGLPAAGHERIAYGAALPAGFDFLSEIPPTGLVVAEDGVSLREPTQAEIDAEASAAFNAVIDEELKQIDIASIRSMREWISAQPGAPQFLIDHESEAQAKRSQRK